MKKSTQLLTTHKWEGVFTEKVKKPVHAIRHNIAYTIHQSDIWELVSLLYRPIRHMGLVPILYTPIRHMG